MKQKDVPSYLENIEHALEMKSIIPHLIGDAAFPLGVHMMKALDPQPTAGSAEAVYNQRILLARRVIERFFGRLKGRWVFCKRNAFWKNLVLSRAAIEVCCALHNSLRRVKWSYPKM
jgi:hypothetical protein